MKKLLATQLLFLTLMFFTYNVFADQWRAAYPYTKKVEGQNVTIKSIPYEPFSASPMKGLTQVYLNNKLLYSVDNYYRERIFASNDGRYLVIVYPLKIPSRKISGLDYKLYEQEVIAVLKDGVPFKTFTLKETLDTASLNYNAKDWLYRWDYETYGARKLKKEEISIFRNSIYVQNNSLFVLTNKNFVVKLDLTTLTLEQLPMEEVIPNKKKFKPPKITVKYRHVRYPDKYFKYRKTGSAFFLPKLKNGKTIEEGIAEFLCLKVGNIRDRDSAVVQLYFHTLIIAKDGKCDYVYVSPSQKTADDKDFSSKYPMDEQDKALKLKVEQWIMEQIFETKTLPKGFPKYAYSDFIYLK